MNVSAFASILIESPALVIPLADALTNVCAVTLVEGVEDST